MRTSRTLCVLILAGAALLGGCHKAVPVAARPSAPVPVETAQKTSAASPSSGAAASTGRPVTQNSRSGISSEERALLNDRLAHLEDAMFDYDKSTIRADAATALKDDVGVIRGILTSYPSETLRIEGHCDERGSDEYNVALGDKRARAVAVFFFSICFYLAQIYLKN
jgi:peptidoglycan-associated lipoprotein